MADQKPRQKFRSHKQSSGTARGARKTKLTELQKVLMGKGMVQTWKPTPR